MKAKGKKKAVKVSGFQLAVASAAATSTSVRRNRAGTIERTDKYANLRTGVIPFNKNQIGSGTTIDVKEAIELCQLAYYNFALFRNTIDIMTELSNSDMYLKGGNKASRDFVKSWLEKVNIWDLKDKFFREYYRSGNVFIYRFDGEFTPEDKKKLTQTFGAVIDKIPLRYIFLNPADIRAAGNISFVDLKFYKVLTNYELERLRNPVTPEDEAILKNLGPDLVAQIKKGQIPLLELDPAHLSSIFYKKQDYEPLAVPFGFPVLDDIDAKLELKKLDLAIARTTQHATLLITMGESARDGGMGLNPLSFSAMKELFANESVARVVIADY